MKLLHRRDLYCWSVFNENLDLDFNAYAWIREGGNVLVDPLPMSEHDRKHLETLGGAAWIVLTNSDHVRGTREIAAWTGAKIAGPAGEKGLFPVECDQWLSDGDELVPGLMALELDGSKTPGELVLLLDGTTLITGDLIRAPRAGRLTMLPEPKIKDRRRAIASAGRLLEHDRIEAVLVGDGWSVFRNAHARLEELLVHMNS